MRVFCLDCRAYFEAGDGSLPPFPDHAGCPREESAQATPAPRPLVRDQSKATKSARLPDGDHGFAPDPPITVAELIKRYGAPLAPFTRDRARRP